MSTATPEPVTREQLMKVVNNAADRVLDQMRWDDTPERDAINLMVNMLGAMLDNPDITVDEVMDEGYDGGAAEVRSWWPGWESAGADTEDDAE